MQSFDIDYLKSLLDKERSALLSASFDVIIQISNEKARLFEDWYSDGIEANMLNSVIDDLRRNQAMLQSTIQGVATARERLIDLAQVRNSITVYDNSGRLTKIPTQTTNILRKA